MLLWEMELGEVIQPTINDIFASHVQARSEVAHKLIKGGHV